MQSCGATNAVVNDRGRRHVGNMRAEAGREQGGWPAPLGAGCDRAVGRASASRSPAWRRIAMPTHLHLRRWHRRISCGCRQHLEAIRELAREGARLLLISGLEIGGRDLDAGVLLPVLTVGEVADQCEERPNLAPGVDEVD